MRILISNDDGIEAPGLAALRAAAVDLGETIVVAPAGPQSAASHSITLSHLEVRRTRVAGPAPFEGTAVDGKPADCVRLAIRRLLNRPVDLVLSGINRGANVGIHVFYSGTVAAAAEASMLGVPAVAFSLGIVDGQAEPDYTEPARYCRMVLDRLLQRGLGRGDLISVNIPVLGPGRPKGVKILPQSRAALEDEYGRKHSLPGEAYEITSWQFHPEQMDADISALEDGYITVTPLQADMTDHAKLDELADDHWNELL